MTDSNAFIDRLQRLIGRNFRYLGRQCRIVEILRDSSRLILEAKDVLPPIQADQYGNAAFRGPEHLEIPLFDADENLSADLMLVLDAVSETRHTAAASCQ